MKSVILNILFVLLYNFPLIKLSSFDAANAEKKNFRNLMKTATENQTTAEPNQIEPLNIFDIQTDETDNNERFNFDNIILNLSTIENKIKSFKNKLEMKYDLDKNKNFLSKNAKKKFNPNLINEYFLSEYIDLTEEIEYYLYEVDFLHNKNATLSLNSREIKLISRFYNLTQRNSKKRNKQYENSLNIYNSISLLMLSMLTGGLIGVMVIIYLSLKNEENLDSFYNKKVYK